jgi:hypothetical protein
VAVLAWCDCSHLYRTYEAEEEYGDILFSVIVFGEYTFSVGATVVVEKSSGEMLGGGLAEP